MDGPLHILFVEASPGFGGSTVALGRLVTALDPTRFRARIAVRDPTQRDHLVEAGVSPRDVAVVALADARPAAPTRGGALLRRLRSLGSSLAATLDNRQRHARHARALVEFAVDRRVDLVHLNNTVCANMGGIQAARILGVPCVVKQHGYEWHSWEIRRLAAQVRVFMPDSEDVARDLDRLGVSRDRITVTYCPVPTSEIRPPDAASGVRDELDIPTGAPVFAIFSCLLAWKGHRVFIEAAARVMREFPDARALVVGGVPRGMEPGYDATLTRLAEELGIADRVLFTGHRGDVARLMCATDVCVHASVDPEPFGMVIGEAMALGRPVIAADAGGPREIVEDGVSGLLARPGDPDHLASRILTVLRDPEMARRLGEAGRARVRALFSLERHASLTAEVYERVVRDGHPTGAA